MTMTVAQRNSSRRQQDVELEGDRERERETGENGCQEPTCESSSKQVRAKDAARAKLQCAASCNNSNNSNNNNNNKRLFCILASQEEDTDKVKEEQGKRIGEEREAESCFSEPSLVADLFVASTESNLNFEF